MDNLTLSRKISEVVHMLFKLNGMAAVH